MKILMLRSLHTIHWVVFQLQYITWIVTMPFSQNVAHIWCCYKCPIVNKFKWISQFIHGWQVTFNIILNSPYPKMIVLETMYVMSNIICHFITCKLISCFIYSFLDLIVNNFFRKKVTDVEIPSKSLNTFFWVLKLIWSSWR